MNSRRGKSVLAMATGVVLTAAGAGALVSVHADGPGMIAQAEKSKSKAQQGNGKSKSEKKSKAASRSGAGVPVLVLIPVVADADSLGGGCWARFFDGENFEGDPLTLVGPVDLPNMKFHQRFYWGGLDSVIVGPKATVIIYDDENYRDRNATLKPGDHIGNLDDQKLGLFEDIESIKISCGQ